MFKKKKKKKKKNIVTSFNIILYLNTYKWYLIFYALYFPFLIVYDFNKTEKIKNKNYYNIYIHIIIIY